MGRSNGKKRRDVNAIANRRLPVSYSPSPRSLQPLSPLRGVSDRRMWHPDGPNRPVTDFNSRPVRLSIPAYQNRNLRPNTKFKPLDFKQTKVAVQFDTPESTTVCVRRNQRKEVLHALRKVGRGSGRQKKPKWTWRSQISCKRK